MFKMTFGLLIVCALLACVNLEQMWLYHHQAWNGARRSLEAENYLRYGYFVHELGPMDNLGLHVKEDGSPKKRDIYWHHPPLTVLALSVFVAVLGEGETTSRLFGATLSVVTFLLFWLALRRRWGDVPTFYALAFLLFNPFYGSYLGFVNFEPMVLLCMALHIWTYERYLERRRRRDMLWVFVTGFLGAYADYPMFVFLFFFWFFTGIASLSKNRRDWKFHAWYVLAVVVTVLLVGFQLYLWRSDAGGFTHIFGHRSNLDSNNNLWSLLKRWNFYYGYFGPFLFAFSFYYVLDLLARLLKRALTLGDAYTMSFGATGLVWLIAMKQGHWIHEYFIFYFAPFFGFAAGYGLFRFTRTVLASRRRLAFAVSLVILGLALVWALPIIHMKRANPIFEYKHAIFDTRNGKKYSYNLHEQQVTKLVKENSAPTDTILIGPGFDHNRFEYRYTLHRDWKTAKHLDDLQRKRKVGQPTRYVLSLSSLSSSEAGYLLQDMSFIGFSRFAVFDLTGKTFPTIQIKRAEYEQQSDLHRLFSSVVYGSYQVVDEPLQSLDMGIKLNHAATVKALASQARSGAFPATSIEDEVAMVNLTVHDGKVAGMDALKKRLVSPEKPVFFGDIEWIGHQFERRGDGRMDFVLVFRPRKAIFTNYSVVLRLEPAQRNKSMRKRMDKIEGVIPQFIPTSLWKPGLVYTYRWTSKLDPGRWKASMKLDFRDPVELVNPQNEKNHFSLRCEPWNRLDSKAGKAAKNKVLPKPLPIGTRNMALTQSEQEAISETEMPQARERLDRWIAKRNLHPLSEDQTLRDAAKAKVDGYLKKAKLGKDFVSWGCYWEAQEKGVQVRLLLSQKTRSTIPWNLEFLSKFRPMDDPKKKREKKKLQNVTKTASLKDILRRSKPNELFYVDLFVPQAEGLSSTSIHLTTGKAKGLRYGPKNKDWYPLGEKNLGIEVPFDGLYDWIVDPYWKK